MSNVQARRSWLTSTLSDGRKIFNWNDYDLFDAWQYIIRKYKRSYKKSNIMFPCHFRTIFVFVQTLCVCIIHVYFRYVCVYALVKVSVE